jgi:(1->4)-alpha-D-glucan 1-alpha-D-glucosylmutase
MKRPTATYRLQFDPAQIDLDGAAELAPYLARLGVSHLYASPLLRSRPGSPHGYDVVDPGEIDPELGGRSGLDHLTRALRQNDMGLILDIVPNHMAVGRHNPWWMDVLEHGRDAAHARHFDLFWDDDGLPLPFLGRPYAEALATGEITLVEDAGTVRVAYWDARFPLSPKSLAAAGLDAADSEITDSIAEFNSDPDRLHRLLDEQAYRLVWWQLSRERLGHRRFFTVTELVGIRQEDPIVFEDTHELITQLVLSGSVDGLRLDHIDGLRDPLGYLESLQEATGGDTWIVVEKILAPREELPPEWPVAGTTGYEYIDASAKAFVDPGGLDALSAHYRDFTGGSLDFDALVHEQQRFIIHERLGPETARFAAALEELARRDRIARDVLPSELIAGAVDVLAALPVYRTYARDGEMSDADRGHIERALEGARALAPERDPRVIDFLREVLLLEHEPGIDDHEARDRIAFVERVQQFTGAVMAKGVEDTAFYQFNLLVSLNEVGGHPIPLPDDPIAAYHAHNRRIAETMPHTMTTASTHDTKRSEDVRARISAITQRAAQWNERIDSWHERNRRHRVSQSSPSRNEELLIYQTLVGAWPIGGGGRFAERLSDYLVKAAREAKVHTAWLEPDIAHESALTTFAAGLVSDVEFIDELETFAAPLWRAGALDSIAHTALRVWAPGVPDVYRGAELWDLSLTDPDNRRPVDWALRLRLLDELDDRSTEDGLILTLAETWEDGRIKLAVTAAALRARRSRPALFGEGAYLPLDVHGDREEHVIAYARHHGDDWALVVVPRLTLQLAGERLWPNDGWDHTEIALPPGAPDVWTDQLTGLEHGWQATIPVAEVFATTPVGIYATNQPDDRNEQ